MLAYVDLVLGFVVYIYVPLKCVQTVYTPPLGNAWCILLVGCCSYWLSDHSDSVVSHPVTCVDAVTVHLRSQCSGGCSDVQETAEVQS